MIIGLLAAVIVVVICSVYAPKLQSNAIDIIASGRFKELTPILITMVVVYIIHSICTFFTDQDKCGIKPEYRKEDERRFIQAHS